MASRIFFVLLIDIRKKSWCATGFDEKEEILFVFQTTTMTASTTNIIMIK
jgi:hypothetical protein